MWCTANSVSRWSSKPIICPPVTSWLLRGCLKDDKLRKPISQCQLNDIINISRDGVEVEGDAVASLCEVETLVGTKDSGRLDFVVASRDEEAGVHTV